MEYRYWFCYDYPTPNGICSACAVLVSQEPIEKIGVEDFRQTIHMETDYSLGFHAPYINITECYPLLHEEGKA